MDVNSVMHQHGNKDWLRGTSKRAPKHYPMHGRGEACGTDREWIKICSQLSFLTLFGSTSHPTPTTPLCSVIESPLVPPNANVVLAVMNILISDDKRWDELMLGGYVAVSTCNFPRVTVTRGNCKIWRFGLDIYILQADWDWWESGGTVQSGEAVVAVERYSGRARTVMQGL